MNNIFERIRQAVTPGLKDAGARLPSAIASGQTTRPASAFLPNLTTALELAARDPQSVAILETTIKVLPRSTEFRATMAVQPQGEKLWHPHGLGFAVEVPDAMLRREDARARRMAQGQSAENVALVQVLNPTIKVALVSIENYSNPLLEKGYAQTEIANGDYLPKARRLEPGLVTIHQTEETQVTSVFLPPAFSSQTQVRARRQEHLRLAQDITSLTPLPCLKDL